MEGDEAQAEPVSIEPVDAGGAEESVTQEEAPQDDWSRSVARAREQIAEAGKESTGEPSGESPDAAPDAEKPAAAAAEATLSGEKLTPQQVLDRIQTLTSQGRENELTPSERGVLRRIRSEAVAAHQQEAEQETQFRDLFLDLDRKAKEEPETFVATLMQSEDGERLVRFYRQYQKDHPDISTDNPNGNGPEQPDKIRQEVAGKWFDDFDRGIESIATAAGIPGEKLTELYEKSAHPFNDYLPAVIDAIAEQKAEASREAIRAEERKAAQLEAQATYAGKTIVVPRVINGSGPGGKETSRPPSDPNKAFDWAARQAREQLAS